MIIDIRKAVLKNKIRSFYSTLFFLTVIAVLLVTDIYSGEIAGIDKYEFSIVLACIYILSALYSTIRNYYYIYYNDEGDKIILRFFSFSFFAQKKNSIELSKKELEGYQIDQKIFGLRENLILYQKTKRGTAKYPPVSITALSKKEKKELLNSLSIYSKNINQKMLQ
jgi:hypothetical protein